MSRRALLLKAVIDLMNGRGKSISGQLAQKLGVAENSVGVPIGEFNVPPKWQGKGGAVDRAWYGLTTADDSPLDIPVREMTPEQKALVAFCLRNRVPVAGFKSGDNQWTCYVVASADGLEESRKLLKSPAALESARKEYVESRRAGMLKRREALTKVAAKSPAKSAKSKSPAKVKSKK